MHGVAETNVTLEVHIFVEFNEFKEQGTVNLYFKLKLDFNNKLSLFCHIFIEILGPKNDFVFCIK